MITASIISAIMEAVRASETSVYFHDTTMLYIPEGCYLQSCHSEKLRSHINKVSFKV
jgi:hypothetical protein